MVSVDLSFERGKLDRYWVNSGWCPPDSTSSAAAMSAYALQEASWQNHALAAAVPNGGIRNMRIHNLLNLLTTPTDEHPIEPRNYNTSLLDALLDMVVGEHGLAVGFEVMGNPRVGNEHSRIGAYTSWKDPSQIVGWEAMVSFLVSRYSRRFGASVVELWRWESWNEPDHNCNSQKKMKANIDCDQGQSCAYLGASRAWDT